MLFATSIKVAGLVAPALVSAYPGPPGPGQDCETARAVYVLTNEARNQVVAVPIGLDGSLSGGTATDTGGAGGVAITAASGQPAGPDGLFSQSALTVAGQSVFAVNPKDSTLSLLAIDARDPTKLTLVGKPATLPGDFPNTVAASAKNQLVCVGLTGAKAGVSCATFSGAGLGKFDALRPFNLGQSTPPAGPPDTVSQVFFSEDESALYATVKSDGTANGTHKGAFAVFPVQAGHWGSPASVASQGTLTAPAGTAVLFGSEPIPSGGENRVFVTDPSFGAGIITVDAHGVATLSARTVVPGQKAICWGVVSTYTGTAFAADGGLDRLTEMSTRDASIVASYDLSADGDAGLIDLMAAGSFLYVLAPGNGTATAAVAVVDLTGGPGKAKLHQHFSLSHLGAGKTTQGLAVLA